MRNADKMLVEMPERKRPLVRPGLTIIIIIIKY